MSELYLSSSDADLVINNNYIFDLNFKSRDSFKTLQIKDFYIPRSFYCMRSQVITINEGGSDITISLTDGNYSISSLLTTLITLMNDHTSTTSTYTSSYSTSSEKATLNATANFTIVETALSTRLGFDGAQATPATSHIATNCWDLLVDKAIFIQIEFNDIRSNNFSSSAIRHGYKHAVLLGRNNPGSVLSNNDESMIKFKLNPINEIDNISISLKHADNTPLNLRGLSWSMSIQIN